MTDPAPDDPGILVCVRVTMTTDPAPHSVIRQCERCGATVWVAPDSMRPPMRTEWELIWCSVCFKEVVERQAIDRGT